MTKEQVLEKLKNCHTGDTEKDHSKADEILCTFLTSLGYKDIVDEYEKIHKWYA